MRLLITLRPRSASWLRKLVPFWDWFLESVRTPLGCLGLAAVASGLCGLLLHPQGMIVSWMLFLVAAGGMIWPWISVRGLSGRISFDRTRCREEDQVRVRLVLRNRLPFAAWGVSVDEGCHGRASDERLCALNQIAGWKQTELSVTFTPRSRGVYPRDSPCVKTGFPFGLWSPSRPIAAEHGLLVRPRTFPVTPMPDATTGVTQNGLAARDRAGTWGDPIGVRPYRRGDPLRRVHWGQTAKRQQLIVSEVQSNAVPRATIILDTEPEVHAGSGPDSSLEWSIRIAASFAIGWIAQGALVDLFAPGMTLAHGRKNQRSRCDDLADALARLTPLVHQDFDLFLQEHAGSRTRATITLIVTTDRRLEHSASSILTRTDVRLVVLRAQGFSSFPDKSGEDSLPIHPWIVIDGPASVPSRLTNVPKELLLET